MPLIEIVALRQPEAVDIDGVTRRINEAVAAAIPCRPEAVWTTWRTIDGSYAVGGRVAAVQPTASHPPIVHVYLRRTPEETARAVDAIERVLAAALSLDPDNVFVTVQPVQALVEPRDP
jgi:hypothetical protein